MDQQWVSNKLNCWVFLSHVQWLEYIIGLCLRMLDYIWPCLTWLIIYNYVWLWMTISKHCQTFITCIQSNSQPRLTMVEYGFNQGWLWLAMVLKGYVRLWHSLMLMSHCDIHLGWLLLKWYIFKWLCHIATFINGYVTLGHRIHLTLLMSN